MSKPTQDLGLQVANAVRALFVAWAYGWRKLGLPAWLLLYEPLKRIHHYWSDEVMLNFIRSAGRVLPMDQPFSLATPTDYRPRTAAAEYPLTTEEIRGFYDNGFLEPVAVSSGDAMAGFCEHLKEHIQRPSTVYGRVTKRDRHFDSLEMMRLAVEPTIIERVAQLLGPDIKLWRSYVFDKPPGGKMVTWHQESSYMYENQFAYPIVVPKDAEQLFQVTVWIAVTQTTCENGCLRLVPGSHRMINNLQLGSEEGYEDAAFVLDYKVDPSRVRDLEMLPGQAVIMSERTIHGSGINSTADRRLAVNFRYVRGDTRIHPHAKRRHYAAQLHESFDMTRWREVLVRGRDQSGSQRLVHVDELLSELEAACSEPVPASVS